MKGVAEMIKLIKAHLVESKVKHPQGPHDMLAAGLITANEFPLVIPNLSLLCQFHIDPTDVIPSKELRVSVRLDNNGSEILFKTEPTMIGNDISGGKVTDHAMVAVGLGEFGFPSAGTYIVEALLTNEIAATAELKISQS